VVVAPPDSPEKSTSAGSIDFNLRSKYVNLQDKPDVNSVFGIIACR